MTESEGREKTPPRATQRIGRPSARLRPLASPDAEPPAKSIDDDAARQELGNLGGVIDYLFKEAEDLGRKNIIDPVKLAAYARWRGIFESANHLLLGYVSARMQQGLDWAVQVGDAKREAEAARRDLDELRQQVAPLSAQLQKLDAESREYSTYAYWAKDEEIPRLEARIKELETERSASEASIEEIRQSVETLQTDMLRTQDENQRLAQENQRLSDENQALQEALATVEPAPAPDDGEEVAQLRREMDIIKRDDRLQKSRLMEQDIELRRLRSELEKSNRATTRWKSIADEKGDPREKEKLKEELSKAQAVSAEHQSTLLGLKRDLDAERGQRLAAERERDRLRQQAERSASEAAKARRDAEEAQRAADQAKRDAERQKELADKARADVAALQSTTRLSKTGVPIFILLTSQQIAGHSEKPVDELYKLFPAPNLGLFLVRCAEAVIAHLANKAATLAELRSAMATIKQNHLDSSFDEDAPLTDALRRGVEESKLWFHKLHQTLALATSQAQQLQGKVGTMREERDAAHRERDELKREAAEVSRGMDLILDELEAVRHLPAVQLNGTGVG